MRRTLASIGLAAGLAWVLQARAATYYVAPGGSDSNNGLTPQNGGAFRTVKKAVQTAGAGDVVRIRSGTYTESIYINAAATAERPLTIEAYPDETPVLRPQSSSFFYLGGARHVILRGLTFTGAQTVNALVLYNTQRVTVEGCSFHGNAEVVVYAWSGQDNRLANGRFYDNTRWCALLDGTRGMEVSGCVFASNRGEVVVGLVGAGSRSNRIASCEFLDNRPGPRQTVAMISLSSAGADHAIQSNRIAQSRVFDDVLPWHGTAGIRVSQTDRVRITDNVIERIQFPFTVDATAANPAYRLAAEEGGRGGVGIGVYGTRTHPVQGVEIARNEVSECGGTGISLDGVNNGYVAGNLVSSNGEYGVHLYGFAGQRDIVTGNVFEGNTALDNGWLHGGMSGLGMGHAGRGNLFRGNVSAFNRQGTAGRKGYDWFADGMGIIVDLDSDGNSVVNNLCYGNEGPGIGVVKSDEILVMNNTIVGNGRCPHFMDFPGLTIAIGDPAEGFTAARSVFVNNLIYNNRLRQVDCGDPAGHVFHHNLYARGPFTDPAVGQTLFLWYDPRGGQPTRAMTFAAWKSFWSGTANSQGDLHADPMLEEPGGGRHPPGYALRPGSPCLNAGDTGADILGPTDGFGRPRIQAGGLDLGAVEGAPDRITLTLPFDNHWTEIMVWNATANRWEPGERFGTQYGVTTIPLYPPVTPCWYWVGVWDYSTWSWLVQAWTASLP